MSTRRTFLWNSAAVIGGASTMTLLGMPAFADKEFEIVKTDAEWKTAFARSLPGPSP